MKKVVFFALSISLVFAACDVLEEIADVATAPTGDTAPALTKEEVASGLKEALIVGTNKSSASAQKEDGFWKNPEIKLPFPEDAVRAKEWAVDNGLGGQVDKFELTLNRAAEEASKEAAPIFIDAVKEMTIQDAFGILNGGEGAATAYLKDKTTAKLTEKFSPKVAAAIEKVSLTKYWEPITNGYNAVANLPFSNKEPINTDLNAYVTGKAIDGLFLMIRKEENNIRANPVARVSDLLKKVFGSLD